MAREPGEQPEQGASAPLETSQTPEEEIAVIPIEDCIDLHGFRPRDVASVVESYLEAAREKGLREVRLIHGRGKGVQRAQIQAWLRNAPFVASFRDAPAHRGGWGATVVLLRPAEQGAAEGPSES